MEEVGEGVDTMTMPQGYLDFKEHGFKLVVGALLAALLGALGVAIYNHEKTPPRVLAVSIAPSARGLVQSVRCSVDRKGDADASGYLGVDWYNYLGTVRVTAVFTAGGQEVQSNYTYVDTTDPSTEGDPGVHPSFSVVGNSESDGFPTSTPTACRITATEHYGSTMANTQPAP